MFICINVHFNKEIPLYLDMATSVSNNSKELLKNQCGGVFLSTYSNCIWSADSTKPHSSKCVLLDAVSYTHLTLPTICSV